MKLQRSSLGVALVFGLLGVAGCAGGEQADPTGTPDASGDTSVGDGSGGDGNVEDTEFALDAPADGSTCLPKTCAALGAECGSQPDGCGGTIDCGTCSVAGESCGGGGFANRCGKPTCAPKTCADLGADCGPAGDGCGNIIQCGTCASGQTCGGGGPSKCGTGDAGTCKAKTCADLGASCGTQSDGCGGTISCGTCTAPATCGGGGVANKCGGGCKPSVTTCPTGACGPIGDGCGNTIPCGSCPSGQACGIVTPSTCSPLPTGDGGTTCTGLCTQIPVCSAGATTTITGKVYAPNGVDPLYNAVVWIPKDTTTALPTFATGPTCEQCGSLAITPLVSALTGPDGSFTLKNVPAGSNIPIIVQLGKWRRKATLPTINPCVANTVGAQYTRLPKNQSEGDIPKTAVVTGWIDNLECTLRKIGVDDAEFTTDAGRIHLYRSNGAFIKYASSPATPGYDTVSMLVDSPTTINKFDQILLACEHDPFDAYKNDTQRKNLKDYVDKGGRLFATHYNYDYLYNYTPFSTTAPWNVNQAISSTGGNKLTGIIDQTYQKQKDFASWLVTIGASTTKGVVTITDYRHDIDDAPSPVTTPPGAWPSSYNSTRWIYSDVSTKPTLYFPKGSIQHYTFNTPVGLAPDKQCGRVVFSDFHVENAVGYSCTSDTQCSTALGAGSKCLCDQPTNDVATCANKVCVRPFPSACTATMSAQEHVLEFMLFDLASCIQNDALPPPPPPSCTPTTCVKEGKNCGQIADGCGGVLSCGTCPSGSTCGTVTPNVCGAGCTPTTCAKLGANCGQQGDGCGNTLNCGTCPTGQTCGGGGVPNQCGGFTCTKRTCADALANCGPVADGCGGVVDCGTCTAPQTCGGGGVPNQCGTGTCTPKTCASYGANCGQVGDGCGKSIDCGTCPTGQTCGGSGTPNVCGGVM
jgi:hypothetical protein